MLRTVHFHVSNCIGKTLEGLERLKLTTRNHGGGLNKCKAFITILQVIEVILVRGQVTPRLAHAREGDEVDLEVLECPAKVDDGVVAAAAGNLLLEHVHQYGDLCINVALNVHEALAREAKDELGLAFVVLVGVHFAKYGVAVGVEPVSRSSQYISDDSA